MRCDRAANTGHILSLAFLDSLQKSSHSVLHNRLAPARHLAKPLRLLLPHFLAIFLSFLNFRFRSLELGLALVLENRYWKRSRQQRPTHATGFDVADEGGEKMPVSTMVARCDNIREQNGNKTKRFRNIVKVLASSLL
jgi:hypothetical protein